MRRNDDERSYRRHDRVQSLRPETEAEHDADEIEQKGPTDTDDDALQIAIVGERHPLGCIADDARDHDRSEQGKKHGREHLCSECPLSGRIVGSAQTDDEAAGNPVSPSGCHRAMRVSPGLSRAPLRNAVPETGPLPAG